MISCILLSAGCSSRFGSPKAVAKLCNDETVIGHLQRSVLSAEIDELIIVLGAESEKITPFILPHEKIQLVYNKDYHLGQTVSFQIGLKHLSADTQGVFLLPIDFPFIKTSTFQYLLGSFIKDRKNFLAIIPTYENKNGHPPLFSTKLRDRLLSLENTVGINIVLHTNLQQTKFLPTQDPGILLHFNTQSEFELINKRKNL